MIRVMDGQYMLWGDIWNPRAPLAGQTKTGPYKRTSRTKALSLPYIEANTTALCSLIITDHDGERADYLAEDNNLPSPSYVSMNPQTRNGHIVYALATPVCLTDAARRRPVNYLARIEAGLQNVLEGDIAYAGRITKNPYHQDHLPLWDEYNGEKLRVYTLRELAEPLAALKVLPKYDIKEPLTTTAIGRNCTLFDHTRKWSYRRRGNYKDLDLWEKTLFAKAWETNETTIATQFTKGPLTASETTHLSRSIARWTWRNIQHTFSEEQAIRGKKGGKVTKIDYQKLLKKATTL